jgi:C_GCAxxG_C_C family probable redox protein
MAKKISKEELKKKAREKAHDYELQFHGCSQSVLLAFQELLGLEDELTFKAASALCAGLGMGKTCGALSGGVMVLGMKRGREHIEEGLNGLIPGLGLAQSLVQRFEQEFGTTSCREITKLDWTDFEAVTKAVTNPEFIERCAQLVGRTAEMVAELIGEEE